MGVLTDAIGAGELDNMSPQERMKFVLIAQHRDPQWMALDPAKRADVMQNVLGIDTSTMQHAIQRRADIMLDKNAGGLTDRGFLKSTEKRFGEGVVGPVVQGVVKAISGPETGHATSLPQKALGGLQAAVAASPIGLGIDTAAAAGGATREGLGRVIGEPADVAQSQGDIAESGIQLGTAALPLAELTARKLIKPTGGAPAIMQHPEKPLELLEENEPASEPTQAQLMAKKIESGVDVSDPKAVVDQHIEERTGVPVDSKVTVGETPISNSKLGDDGTPEVNLSDPSVQSGVHEAEHMASDINGTSQPPEDNEQIAQAAISGEPAPWGQGPEKEALEGPQAPELVDMGESESAGSPAEENMGAQTRPDETVINPEAAQPGRMAGQPSPNPYNGPREQPQGQIPPELDYESSDRIGNEKKFKPMADTPPPKTPQEAKNRGGFFDLATRLYQAGVASLSGPRIWLTSHLRIMSEAVTQAGSRLATGAANPWEGFKALTRIYNRAEVRPVIDAMMEADPEAGARFQAGGSFDPTTNVLANKLGTVNRLAHFLPKSAAMTSRLETSLMQRGLTLEDVGKAAKEELADAMAYGDSVGLTAKPQSRIARSLLGVFQTPAGRMFSLFPRLVSNTLQVMNRWNPLLIRKIVDPEIWKAVAGRTGDPAATAALEQVARASISWAAIYGGYKMQEQNPNFMQVNIGGHELNVSHMIPGIGQYAMIGATIQRGLHMVPGAEQKMFRDIMADLTKGIVGQPGPAGEEALNIGTGEATMAGAKRSAARTIGGFTQPFEIAKDIMGLFDSESAKARDGAGGWFDPSLSHIPFAANTLPEQRRPDRPGTRPNVADERLYGVPIRETPTAAQNEMTKYGVHPAWYPYGGDEAKNLAYRDQAGALNQQKVDNLIKSPEYQKAPDVIKRQLLEKMVGGTRRDLTKDKVSDTKQAINNSQVK